MPIVYIDDENTSIEEYKEELEFAGFSVLLFERVEPAWDWLSVQETPPEAVVLDVMMPPGERYDINLTQEGLLTGVFLYKDLRGRFGDGLKVFILTNNTDSYISEATQEDPNAMVMYKGDFLSDEFRSIVEAELRRS